MSIEATKPVAEAQVGSGLIQRLGDGSIQFTSPRPGGLLRRLRGTSEQVYVTELFDVIEAEYGLASIALVYADDAIDLNDAPAGQTVTAAVTATYEDTSTRSVTSGVTFVSSDPEVATVDPNTGAVTAVAVGTVTITATYLGETATDTVTVSDSGA